MKNSSKKEELRKKYMKKRKKIANKKGESKSNKITTNLLSLDILKNPKNILLYISYRSEVDTEQLINKLLKKSKNVFAPYCIKDEKRMEIVQINDPTKDLKKGAYGIKEPKNSLRKKDNEINQLDIVIVPAVAFSKSGYRIGYGGGYYDRFLSRLSSKTISIGINYDELIFESVPKEDHDLAVDIIVTDKKILKTKS
mgnify:FL=1